PRGKPVASARVLQVALETASNKRPALEVSGQLVFVAIMLLKVCHVEQTVSLRRMIGIQRGRKPRRVGIALHRGRNAPNSSI
ncbi:MAG TPA: hypothetical protein VGN86_15450, partial [Pyrinomonadaceae bacterium]|nr:hypothetical protein [Pyrinomonadaceae bacterium]